MTEETSLNLDAMAAAYLDVAYQRPSASTYQLNRRPYCGKI